MGIAAGRTLLGSWSDPTLRWKSRVVMIFFAIVVAAGLIVTGLAFSRAFEERAALRQRALDTASVLSSAFDQEVTAYRYVLRGLSQAPALHSGDFKAFYDQMKATTVSGDSWFILNDLERQIFNTLRPFGDQSLPRHSAFPNHLEILERIRNLRWSVSGRIFGIIKGGVTIALSQRIDGPDGEMKYFITTLLSDKRLNALIDDRRLPKGWLAGVFDRKLATITTARDGVHSPDVRMSTVTIAQLRDEQRRGAMPGAFESVDANGLPILVAFRRSEATDWTTKIELPLTMLNAPIGRVLRDVALPCAALLLLGGLAAVLATRLVDTPFHALRGEVALANSTVSELSVQLLAVQEDERQRIARELHDSTAQHLVAANLELMRLESHVAHSPQMTAAREVIGDLIGKALTEMRVFTYLLHPPNLASDGLQTTLEQFIEGFAKRTGLQATTAIAREINDVSPEAQCALLRVVQEALANVHRHAHATRISVQARTFSGQLVIRIRDNGLGFGNDLAKSHGMPLLGVGIRGMNARLRQINGRLLVRSRSTGTVVMAVIRLSRPERADIRGRLLRSVRAAA